MQDLKIIDEKQRQKVYEPLINYDKPGFGIKELKNY